MILVYVQGMHGPVPQLWHDAATDGAGKAKPTLQQHPITPEMLLDIIAAHFPYKGAPDVNKP